MGRNKFNGTSTYQYVNLGDDTLSIDFDNFKYIESEKKKEGFYTVGRGSVKEEDTLHIGPKILYKGNVTMYARQQFLTFEGYVKLDLVGAFNFSEWLKYQNSGQTKNVDIDLATAVASNGKPLETGLCIEKASFNLYPTFISLRKSEDDKRILPVLGNLIFNPDSSEFSIGDSLKLIGRAYKGNFLSYNDDKSTLKFGGKFDFLEKHSNVSAIIAGEGFADLKSNQFNANFLLAINFKVSSVLDIIGKNLSLIASIMPQESFDVTEEQFKKTKAKEDLLFKKLAEEIGDDGIEKYKAKKSLEPVTLSSLSSDFSKSILIQDVDMKWSNDYKSFYSVGKFKVASVLKNEVNKEMPGYIEIRKTIRGDVINILLEPTYGNWFFITYEDNRLAIVTGNADLNTQLEAKSKGEMADRTKFYYVQAGAMEKKQFELGFAERYGAERLSKEVVEDTTGAVEDSLQNEEELEEPGVGETNDSTDQTTQKARKKKDVTSDVNDEFNSKESYDEYKVNETDTNYEQEEAKKKEQSSAEQKLQMQRDQQKLKDMLK